MKPVLDNKMSIFEEYGAFKFCFYLCLENVYYRYYKCLILTTTDNNDDTPANTNCSYNDTSYFFF